MTEKIYGGAIVTFLNRDNQSEKKAIIYPITRIELLVLEPGTRPQVIYEPQEDGSWKVVGP